MSKDDRIISEKEWANKCIRLEQAISDLKRKLEERKVPEVDTIYRIIKNAEGNLMGQEIGYLCGLVYLERLAKTIVDYFQKGEK